MTRNEVVDNILEDISKVASKESELNVYINNEKELKDILITKTNKVSHSEYETLVNLENKYFLHYITDERKDMFTTNSIFKVIN